MFQFFLNMVETEKKKSAHECYLMPLLDLSIGSKPACLKAEVREFKYLEVPIVDMVLATL